MKNRRREEIIELISKKTIVTQDELLEELLKLGYDVTQSTVSRDIKTLRIIKGLDGNGNYKYMLPGSENSLNLRDDNHYFDMLKKSAISVHYACNDVVVKCYSGLASSACVAIDKMFSNRILGSLAGDDTILIITEDETAAAFLADAIGKIL